jgi:hypothetical protein
MFFLTGSESTKQEQMEDLEIGKNISIGHTFSGSIGKGYVIKCFTGIRNRKSDDSLLVKMIPASDYPAWDLSEAGNLKAFTRHLFSQIFPSSISGRSLVSI